MNCPACHAQQHSGSRFCEDCGAVLAHVPSAGTQATLPEPARVCPQCGTAGGVDAQGFCPGCGLERESDIADHVEAAASQQIAGVSDRGKVRHRNEDFFAVATSPTVDVLVVCDGVSNSQQSDRAARAAAELACQHILDSFASAAKADAQHNTRNMLLAALSVADAAVRRLPKIDGHPADPAETTIVAAVRLAARLVIGWLGDSRAYWAHGKILRRLTEDHSWLNETIAAGELSLDEALLHPQAHAITRTLGGPGDDADEPSVIEYEIGRELPTPGYLVLCTDGFWDMARDESEFDSLVLDWIERESKNSPALSLARNLVENACRHRGHDNVTVAVMTWSGV